MVSTGNTHEGGPGNEVIAIIECYHYRTMFFLHSETPVV